WQPWRGSVRTREHASTENPLRVDPPNPRLQRKRAVWFPFPSLQKCRCRLLRGSRFPARRARVPLRCLDFSKTAGRGEPFNQQLIRIWFARAGNRRCSTSGEIAKQLDENRLGLIGDDFGHLKQKAAAEDDSGR